MGLPWKALPLFVLEAWLLLQVLSHLVRWVTGIPLDTASPRPADAVHIPQGLGLPFGAPPTLPKDLVSDICRQNIQCHHIP